MKLNYFIIPLIVFVVSFLGGQITRSGMDWYKSINIPSWTPPGWIIGLVWTIIFIFSAVSIIIFWNSGLKPLYFNWVIGLFVLNAILNIFWSYLFFGQHLIGIAVIEAFILGLSVLVLIVLIWPFSLLSALLFMPYCGWVFFATYLTYSIWLLNK
ncbi:MAG: TspO/MBR family protein [Minisyncoccota bacterium]